MADAPRLLSEAQLMDWAGARTPAALERILRRGGIPFMRGDRGRIITTLDAINAKLGVGTQTATADDDDFA